MLLRHIRYFLAVAGQRSFTRAAASLHVSQPALSQQIRQLEERLGVELFDRSGRTLRLTDAGETYADYARRAVLDLEAGARALHDVSDLSRGSLRLGFTPPLASYLCGPLVEAFHRLHPHIVMTVREMPQERIEALLADDELDVGIGFDENPTADIETQALLTETLALVVGRDHPHARRRSIGLPALNRESLVLLSAEFATREQIDRYCRQHGVQPRVAVEANSVGAVVEIVRRSGLASLLPAAVASHANDLHAITLRPRLLERTAVLLLRRDAYRSAAARAFVALALKEKPAGVRRGTGKR